MGSLRVSAGVVAWYTWVLGRVAGEYTPYHEQELLSHVGNGNLTRTVTMQAGDSGCIGNPTHVCCSAVAVRWDHRGGRCSHPSGSGGR